MEQNFNDMLSDTVQILDNKRAAFKAFIGEFGEHIEYINTISNDINSFLGEKREELTTIDEKIAVKKQELDGIKNTISSSVQIQESEIPYVVREGYIIYHLYIYQKIETIVHNHVRYSIPSNLVSRYVNGMIFITVDMESKQIVRISGNLNNYIHQSTSSGSLCLGDLHIDTVDEFTISRIQNQVKIANLDSPHQGHRLTRSLREQVKKIIALGDEGIAEHRRNTWRV